MDISEKLKEHIENHSELEYTDIYKLELANGNVYYFTSYDADVELDGIVYDHKTFRIKRESIKMQGEPSVDSLSVIFYCEKSDTIEGESFMKAVHEGLLDQAILTLSKAFCDNGEWIGAYSVFNGRCEVSGAGGLAVKLNVKSIFQGLASLLPTRIFTSMAGFSTQDGVVKVSDTDKTSMMIPLKPSMSVLIKL